MEQKLRRIVTGHNKNGKSIIEIDDSPTQFGGLIELWVTDQFPEDNSTKKDPTKRKIKLEPPDNGTIFRYFKIYPQELEKNLSSEEIRKRVVNEPITPLYYIINKL